MPRLSKPRMPGAVQERLEHVVVRAREAGQVITAVAQALGEDGVRAAQQAGAWAAEQGGQVLEDAAGVMEDASRLLGHTAFAFGKAGGGHALRAAAGLARAAAERLAPRDSEPPEVPQVAPPVDGSE